MSTLFLSRSNNAKCRQPRPNSTRRLAVEPLNLFRQHVGYKLPFQFQKSSQLFIRTNNEAPSVIAVRIGNPDCSPFGIDGRDVAVAPVGLAEIVSDDLRVLHGSGFTAAFPRRVFGKQ